MNETQTLFETYTRMLPVMGIAFVAGYLWLLTARCLMRRQDMTFNKKLKSLDDAITADKLNFTLLVDRLSLFKSGKPSDSLFFAGLATATVAVLLLLATRFFLSFQA